jgi:bleomycin hydrolase
MKEINDALLQSFRAKVAADPSVSVLNGALAKTDLADLSFVPMQAALHDGPFAVEVKTRALQPRNSPAGAGCSPP